MSGVSGVIRWDGGPVTRSVLEEMIAAAPHRGPNHVALWCEGSAGLAHQALHVTPEDAAERQPVTSGALTVVADARIDNRTELVGQLGDELFGQPPTIGALLLAGYRRWGDELPVRILGDFAFVIWDAGRRRVFAARDPMGLRTLYYSTGSDRTIFATEVKQILAVSGVTARICERAVANHLVAGLGPSTHTFYEGVHLLAAGRLLAVEEAGANGRRFWPVDPNRRLRYATEAEYGEHFLELLEDAVRCRMRGPRPVGVFLSGGVDSGSVGALAGRLRRHEPTLTPEVRAYSFAFDELTQCDERRVSQGIVDAYELAETPIPADDAWPLQAGPEHEPDQDAPAILWFYGLWNRALARARSLGTVALLGGDRGDLVAGEAIYDHTGLFWRGRWPTLMRELRLLSGRQNEPLARVARRSLVTPISRALWPESAPRRWLRRVRRGNSEGGASGPPWVRPDFLRSHRTSTDGLDVSDRTGPAIRGHARHQRHAALFAPSQLAAFVESERLYARHGTCFADPFSDRRIAEFVLAIPARVVNRPDDRKRLVKRAMKGVVPEDTAVGQKKVTPWPLAERALKEREVETVRYLLRDSVAEAYGWIDGSRLQALYEAYLHGAPLPAEFWPTLSLEVWLRRYWT